MIDTEALIAFRCANPECPSRRHGRGQIVMRGDRRPGWRGEGRCHQCGALTYIEIDDAGLAAYFVRGGRVTSCGG